MSNKKIIQGQRDDYQKRGFIRLPQLFSRAKVATFEQDISAAVARPADLTVDKHPNSESDTYAQAFTQVMNLWRHDLKVRSIVFNR